MTIAALWRKRALDTWYSDDVNYPDYLPDTLHVWVTRYYDGKDKDALSFAEGDLKLCHVKMNDVCNVLEYLSMATTKPRRCQSCLFRRRIIKELRR